MNILKENRKVLDDISEALMIWETLDYEQIKDIAAGKDIGVPLIAKASEKKSSDGDNEKKESEVKETESSSSSIDTTKDPVTV